jgi:Holliday junction resolvase RusA-like endonuclease
MKKNYKAIMAKQIILLPQFNRVRLVYTLYPKDRRKCDVSNICSIHDKFFSDALVEMGKIEDDNYLYIPEIDYRFGEIDKDRPRVEIRIIEIGTE